MPTSAADLNSGLAIFGVMVFVAVAASLLTVIVSAALLAAYRRRVGAIMATDAAATGVIPIRRADAPPPPGHVLRAPPPEPDRPADGPQEIGTADAEGVTGGVAAALHRRLTKEPWRLCVRYTVAGTGFALFLASVYSLAVFQPQANFGSFFHPYRALYLFWTFIWPVALMATIVAASSWRSRFSVVVLYFAGLALLGALVTLGQTQAAQQWGGVTFSPWASMTPVMAVTQWAMLNALPTAAILGFRHRRVRAVGPLVLAFMTVVAAGVAGLLLLLLANGTSEPALRLLAWLSQTFTLPAAWAITAYFLVPALIGSVLFALLGARLLSRIRRSYGRKTSSDQSLFLDAMWLTFGFTYAMALAVFGPAWATAGLPAFFVYKGALWLTNRRGRGNHGSGCRLLLLRVFSLGRRSEALFARVVARWRYVGSVQLIAGSDLAAATVAPHLFLDFLGGKLSAAFVADEDALDHRLQGLDTVRDADGRFRVNDLFCYADTWQSVLTRLIVDSDVVLMDLRSFSQRNAGCIHELSRLVEVAPAAGVVLIIDATTDLALVRSIVDGSIVDRSIAGDGGRKMPTEPPGEDRPPPAIEMVWLASLGPSDLDRLYRQLCHAGAAAALRRQHKPANAMVSPGLRPDHTGVGRRRTTSPG